MVFSINFLTNVLVIALGLLALITGISIFPTTKKYKTAAITFSHSKKEWTWISLLERAIAIFYFVIFSVVLISVVLIAVSYDIATFGAQAAIWERTDIWYYPLFSMFVPFAAIMVCSAVALPLILKAKRATLCSPKNIELLKNTKSGLSEKSACAVCNYSIFVCAFNILAAAAVIVLTFLRFIASTAIFASNEYIQVLMAGIIILSLIFMFTLAIVMSANSRKSKYKILNFNAFMKAEYMNKDQVVRTKGWNAIFVFAQLFGLIALGGFIAISLVWFMSFNNWPVGIDLEDFEKQILIYVSYGLAGSAALSLIFSLITIASLKYNFYNTRALFTQNWILSLLGVVASAAYIVIGLRFATIFNPLPTAMSIGQILIIIALFTLIPGFIAYLVLTGYFINKQNEKPYLLYSYIQTLNKNKKKEDVVPTVQSQPAVASTTYVQQPQPVYNNTSPIYANVTNTLDHESAKQISELHEEIAKLKKTIESSNTKPTITTDQSQPVVASTTYVQQPQSNGDYESAKQISELHEEIAELKKTIESSNTKPTITTDQIEDILAYIDINRVANEKSRTTYPIWKNIKGSSQVKKSVKQEEPKETKTTLYPIWKNRKGLNPRFKKKSSPKKKNSKKHNKKKDKIIFKERRFFQRKPKKDSKKKK